MTGKEFLEQMVAQVHANGDSNEEIKYNDVLDYLASMGFDEAIREYSEDLTSEGN